MKNKTALRISVLSLAIIGFSACKKKKPEPENNNTGDATAGYVVGFRSSDGSADYLLTISDLMSGTISSSGNGIEQAGWCYYARTNNRYLTFDYDESYCTGYSLMDGALQQQGQFIFDRVDIMEHSTADDKIFAIGAPWGGGSFDCNFQTIDAQAMAITNNVSKLIYAPDYQGNQINVWPTDAKVVGDKVFVPFYPVIGDTWETPLTDTAYVAVYSYPGFQEIAILKDARTSPIGYYGDQPVLMEAENGDIYTISSSSYAAGYTQITRPSGILKIDAGTHDFDDSYFMNIENEGYRILCGTYAGNGKIVARVISITNDDLSGAGSWAAFSASTPACNIAVIDVYNQSFHIVSQIPLHGGQYKTPFHKEGGKVYVSVNTGSQTNIYQVDPSTGTAVQGATISGSELQGFFKY